jgi:hypothetical protein
MMLFDSGRVVAIKAGEEDKNKGKGGEEDEGNADEVLIDSSEYKVFSLINVVYAK